MNLTLEKWWHGYVVSPLGTVVGVALFGILSIVRTPHLALNTIGSVFGIAVLAVLISYVVGLMLLPVFVVFEACDWRGWKVYVVTGLAARPNYALA